MRTFTTVILTFILGNSLGQTVIMLDTYPVDTIVLKEFTEKKIVAYNINSVTVFVKYEDYKSEFDAIWERYHQMEMRMTETEAKDKDDDDLEYEARWKLMDSVHSLLETRVQYSDTVYLSHEIFTRVGFGCLMNLSKQIEAGTCAVTDKKNKRHYTIIRRPVSRHRGRMNISGGRQYFLPKSKTCFYEVTDWIT